jgi:hypothetical protein
MRSDAANVGLSRRGPLRVVLLTRAHALPRWQAGALERLESEGVASVAGILAVDERAAAIERACRALHEALERMRPPLGDLLDARAVFPDAPALDRDAAAAFDLVVSCGVDASLARAVRGRIGTLACSFAGAADDVGLLRSFVDGRGFSLSAVLYAGGGEVRLCSAWPAVPERPLLGQAKRNVLPRAAAVLEKALRELAAGSADASPAPADAAAPPVTLARACRYGSRRAAQWIRRGLRKLAGGVSGDPDANWFLAYRTNREDFVCNSERFRADGYRLVLPPPGRFYADPCVIEHQGEDHVFFEEWRSDVNRGVISWMKREGDRFTPPEQVLERPYHLSYPFVFRSGGDVFMVPESGAARRIELYRAADFPERWEPVEILVDGITAADPTLLEIDGRWWMFANVAGEGSSKCDQLWLFHADAAGGPWRPHARNPVKIDVRSTRPAGSLFRRGGRLIRPSQDCSMSYGGALTLCEVTRLSRAEYAEVEVEKLLPGWLPSNLGFHTLSSSARLEVIDGKMPSGKESRFPVFEGALYAEAPA